MLLAAVGSPRLSGAAGAWKLSGCGTAAACRASSRPLLGTPAVPRQCTRFWGVWATSQAALAPCARTSGAAPAAREREPTGHRTLSTCGAGVGGSSRRQLQRQRRLRGRGIRGALEPRRQLIEGRVEKPLPPAVPPKPQSPPRSSTHRWPSGSVSAVPPRQRLPVCSADLSPPPLPRRL